jgi:hypothetical protein
VFGILNVKYYLLKNGVIGIHLERMIDEVYEMRNA